MSMLTIADGSILGVLGLIALLMIGSFVVYPLEQLAYDYEHRGTLAEQHWRSQVRSFGLKLATELAELDAY